MSGDEQDPTNDVCSECNYTCNKLDVDGTTLAGVAHSAPVSAKGQC